MALPWDAWLRRARHDLVKRMLWPARDRRELGGPVHPGELVASLIDDEGSPATLASVWADLRAAAPTPEHAALRAFERSLLAAATAAGRDDLEGVLALEAAFERLFQEIAGGE